MLLVVIVFSGTKFPSVEGYKLNFGTAQKPHATSITTVLHDLYKTLGVLNSNTTSVDISREEFLYGTTIIPFLFDLNDLKTHFSSYDSEPGILSLSLKFNKATEQPLSVFCFQLVNAAAHYHSDGVIVSTH